MSSPKPTILIIHGAWHQPAHFSPLMTLLKAQGYTSICPHLPTCNNDDPPTKSLSDDVLLIRNTTISLADQGKEVVVLMASYGGVVGTDALYGLSVTERAKNGLPCGVKRLVYISAFIPQLGQSLAGIFGGMLPPWIVDNVNSLSAYTSFGLTKTIQPPFLTPTNPHEHFYHDVPNAQHWMEQLVKHPRSAQYDNAVSHEAFRDVPVTFLLCEEDKAIPVEVQIMMIGKIEEQGVEVTVERCGASHSVFLSMPSRVVEVVGRVSA